MEPSPFRTMITALLAAAATGAAIPAYASAFTVTSATSGQTTTFTVTRSGDTSVAETVAYRAVSRSALAGLHFRETASRPRSGSTRNIHCRPSESFRGDFEPDDSRDDGAEEAIFSQHKTRVSSPSEEFLTMSSSKRTAPAFATNITVEPPNLKNPFSSPFACLSPEYVWTIVPTPNAPTSTR